MLRKILIASVTLMLTAMTHSCKKANLKEPAPKPPKPKPCYNIELLKEKEWKPVYTFGTRPRFYANGQYFENGKPVGTWAAVCDCVTVTGTPANTFFFKIQALTDDTFKVYTPRYNCTVFYK